MSDFKKVARKNPRGKLCSEYSSFVGSYLDKEDNIKLQNAFV